MARCMCSLVVVVMNPVYPVATKWRPRAQPDGCRPILAGRAGAEGRGSESKETSLDIEYLWLAAHAAISIHSIANDLR